MVSEISSNLTNIMLNKTPDVNSYKPLLSKQAISDNLSFTGTVNYQIVENIAKEMLEKFDTQLLQWKEIKSPLKSLLSFLNPAKAERTVKMMTKHPDYGKVMVSMSSESAKRHGYHCIYFVPGNKVMASVDIPGKSPEYTLNKENPIYQLAEKVIMKHGDPDKIDKINKIAKNTITETNPADFAH